MWLLSILLILAILVLGLLFIIGIIIFIIGKFKKNDENKISKIGLKIVLIPITIIATILVYGLIREVFTSKPNKKDLVGKYEMSNSSFIDNRKENYNLEFFENGNFKISKTPYIDLCENGIYDVDYEFEDNEVSLKCGNGYSTARIDREFGNYKIEFIIGDPDSGESIYFEKIEK
jgi:energy-coupling factor transporter transmembrane protein EcfT